MAYNNLDEAVAAAAPQLIDYPASGDGTFTFSVGGHTVSVKSYLDLLQQYQAFEKQGWLDSDDARKTFGDALTVGPQGVFKSDEEIMASLTGNHAHSLAQLKSPGIEQLLVDWRFFRDLPEAQDAKSRQLITAAIRNNPVAADNEMQNHLVTMVEHKALGLVKPKDLLQSARQLDLFSLLGRGLDQRLAVDEHLKNMMTPSLLKDMVSASLRSHPEWLANMIKTSGREDVLKAIKEGFLLKYDAYSQNPQQIDAVLNQAVAAYDRSQAAQGGAP